MQMSGKNGDLDGLDPEMRALLTQGSAIGGGKHTSMLSKFANVDRKDYVHYNQEQLRIYRLLN